MFDVCEFRKNFSFVNEHVFFDSSAISLIPDCVTEKVSSVLYKPLTSFRSVYSHEIEQYVFDTKKDILSLFVEKDQPFKVFFGLNASDVLFKFIILCVKNLLSEDDIVLVSKHSHHSLTGCVAYLKNYCSVSWLEESQNINKNKVKFVFLQHVSNITGKVNHYDLTSLKKNFPFSKFIMDISQSFGFVNKSLFSVCDGLFFSAHKFLSYTGLGVFIVNKNISFETFPSGGNISSISKDFTIDFSQNTMEMGTLNSISIIAFHFVIKFIESFVNVHDYLMKLNNYFVAKALNIRRSDIFSFLGLEFNKKPIFSLYSNFFHSHDLGDYLFSKKIFVRTGFQCCSTCINRDVTRISLFPYNTFEEIDYFFSILESSELCI